MKKTLLSAVLTVSLLAQTASAATTGTFPVFSDVNANTNYISSIGWMSDNGVVQGYPDGTFKPDQCVNRAEFLKMMFLVSEKDIITTDSSAGSNYYDNFFSDTSTQEWYWPYVKEALKLETIEGYPDGTFKPGQCVNRVEAVKMAVLGLNEGQIPTYGAMIGKPYDILLMGNLDNVWWWPYLYYALSANILGLDHFERYNADWTGLGVVDSNYANPTFDFKPGDSMTRKEVAEMLYRMKAVKDSNTDHYQTDLTINSLNFYISPTSGVSFMMTDGWEVISDEYYETPGGAVADYPTIQIIGPDDERVSINMPMMQCEGEMSITCFELAEGYTIGANGPTAEAMFLINRILLTFKVPEPQFNTYNNEVYNLSFNYPLNWTLKNEQTTAMGNSTQLQLMLENNDNPNVTMSVYTPPREVGYENATIEEGFSRTIEGLTSNHARLLRYSEINLLKAWNSYYIDEADWSTHIEFFFSATGNGFDQYLPNYYSLLDSVVFNPQSEV